MADEPQVGPGAERAPGDAAPMYQLGRVGKAHGLDGAFVVTRPKGEHLVAGALLTVAGEEREVVRRSGTDARPILRLAGVDGLAAAEALRGTDLLMPRALLPDLEEDEYWPEDLVGLPVRATTGEPVGTLAEVLPMPSVDVLRVARPGAGDLLVPFHREAVPVFDVGARDVAIDLVFLDEPVPGPDATPAQDAGSSPADARSTADEG